MPVDPESGFFVRPASQMLTEIQEGVDSRMRAAGLPAFVWTDAHNAALSESIARIAFDVEEGQRTTYDGTDVGTAVGPALDRQYNGKPARRAATSSRYTFLATKASFAAGTITYPAGSLVDMDGIRFAVVADTPLTAPTTRVLFEAVETGPNVLPETVTVVGDIVTPVSGVESVTYDGALGDDYQIGRNREEDPAYKVRAELTRASLEGATAPGLRTALYGLSWVNNVSIEQVGNVGLGVNVVPLPIGDDQTDELVAVLRDVAAFPTLFEGDFSAVTRLPGGAPYTVKWSGLTVQGVAVDYAVRLDGVAFADIEGTINQAIAAVFTVLDAGEILRYSRVYSAIASVPGVVGIDTLTLDGATDDIVPQETTVLGVGAITGAAA